MDEIKNIVVVSPTLGTYSIDAFYFLNTVCGGNVEPLVALVNGRVFEKKGVKYCVDANEFKLDPVADAWFNK
ncbi:hypothetical protein [Enterococcus wangshanyuanii]|uniref:Uncharacterized protein n=1 Tax=Enterococcus wangshanyuanii TaxID=2005703 RepID=A0ABQ1P020_9ENTE|nr:hypothetical protein [Enterococcus wangshanyuanii]GGC88259.1 hypothetical protein GCM10011573_17340 [Enterococcus wangshanyuanii]